MADERLRELERAFRASGGAEAGSAYLQGLRRAGGSSQEILRVRVAIGEVHPERLRLAAYAGDADARAVLGPAAPPVPEGFYQWTLGLGQLPPDRWHPLYLSSELLASAPWAAFDAPARWGPPARWEDRSSWLEATVPWFRQAVIRVYAAALREFALGETGDEGRGPGWIDTRRATLEAALLAEACLAETPPDAVGDYSILKTTTVWTASDSWAEEAARVAVAAVGGRSEEPLRERVRATLVPWALGVTE